MLAFALAMATRLAAQAAAPAWPVASQPVTTIGIGEGDATRELADVSSAHRLADGSVVVANGKPLELRIYTPAGMLLRRIGRDGEGPGEFRNQVQVFGLPGDSLLTFTSGNARWGLFLPGGKLVREWPSVGREWARDLRIYRNAFTTRSVNAPFACVRTLVDRMPTTSDPIREVVADAAGRFWVGGAGASEWTVYTLAGKAVGRVKLPADAELLEAANGAAVVKRRDADDIERVEVWQVTMPATSPRINDACRQANDTLVYSATGVTEARMRTDLRNMQTAAKKRFDDTHTYPRTFADFHYPLSTTAELEPRMLMSNEHGWGAMITDRMAGFYCVAFVHDGVIPGWPSGRSVCAPIVVGPPGR